VDVVRYCEAGETILSSLAEELQSQFGMAEVALFKCNVDYGGTGIPGLSRELPASGQSRAASSPDHPAPGITGHLHRRRGFKSAQRLEFTLSHEWPTSFRKWQRQYT